VAFDFQASYDELNPDDDDYRCYTALAIEIGAQRVLDLGCGTGRLARLIAAQGIHVVGIDPDPDMLRVASSKPTIGHIDWRRGYSDNADPNSADLVVMSGHVAQVFTDDDAWSRVLADLRRALIPGGTLAFETRNPGHRKWQQWTRGQTLRTLTTRTGPVEFWHETIKVELPRVTYETHTRDLTSGEETCSRNVLAFRDKGTVRSSLLAAGFEIADLYGDWNRTPATDRAPEIIVIAVKSDSWASPLRPPMRGAGF
jgi:SAM-dependent methyltransferase